MKPIFILLLISISSKSFACTCGKISKINKETIVQAKDIFVGRAIKIESAEYYRGRKITFEIIEKLKTDSNTRIEIYTGVSGADCGLEIKEGEEWYIFSNINRGVSWSGLCGRSTLLSDHSFVNPIQKSYKKVVKKYKKEKRRANREIRYIRNTQS